MTEDPVARILKMVEDGKISAADAERLISALRAGPRDQRQGQQSETHKPEGGESDFAANAGGRGRGGERSYEFRWGRSHRGSGPIDLSTLSRQLGSLLARLDPDRLVSEAVEEGRRWQQRAREWARAWPESAEAPPRNTRGWPATRKSEHREFEVGEHLRLHVNNPAGDVVIVGGSPGVALDTSLEAWAGTVEEAKARAQDVRVETSLAAGQTDAAAGGIPQLDVRVVTPSDWKDGLVHLLLRVPSDTHAQVATTFGDVRVEALGGAVSVATSSGSVVLDGVSGPATVESVSGDIRAHRLREMLSVTGHSGEIIADELSGGAVLATVSGDIRLRHVSGPTVVARSVSSSVDVEHVGAADGSALELTTASGDIRLVDAAGSAVVTTVSGDVDARRIRLNAVRARTVSGDVRIAFEEPFSGSLNASTVSGDVQVVLPEGSGFRYLLKSRSGRLACDLPSADAVRGPTESQGTVATGEGSVEIVTLSGDVSLGLAGSVRDA